MSVQPRTATVEIFQGDYLDRIRHLERRADAAAEAEANTTRTNDEIPLSVKLVEEHNALVKEAEESALRIVLKALPRKEWKALIADHPPREDNKSDQGVGVNEDTFKDALVPVSIVEPADFTEDDLDALSDADYDRLYYTAFSLNRGVAAAPKALPLSQMSPTSDETSS